MDNMRKSTDTLIKDGNKAMDPVNDIAETVWQKGRESVREWSGQGQEAFDQARKSAKQVWDDTHKLVQKHPAKSMGIAVLAGVVIGVALMAMRKDS